MSGNAISEGLQGQRERIPMLEGLMREPDLAEHAMSAFASLPESKSVHIAAEMVPGNTIDFAKGDRTTRSVGAAAWQAVPARAEAPDGSISVSLVDLARVGKIPDPQATEDASSESDEKRRLSRPHESADRVSIEAPLLLEQWRTAAERGDTDAQFKLGSAYLVGWGVEPNAATAAKWFEEAAQRGDVKAQFNLGAIYIADGVQRDTHRALRWFKAAAGQGDREAQFNLGRIYANGDGVENDTNEAIRWYRRAAANGHPEAQFNLGVVHTPGLGEKRNVHEAIQFYEQAFTNEVVEAAFNIAMIYSKGVEVQKDSEEAVMWYTRAAEKGLANAQYHLALCFTNGTGVSKDHKAAFDWFSAAAEQGDEASQHNLAISYDRGLGVNRNPEKAVYWFRKSANQGCPYSQYWLGIKYAKGEGVEKSVSSAYVWIRYASEQGNADSQYLLASMYYHGQGVFVDYPEAYKWVTLGLRNGASNVDECVQLRDDIKDKLYHDQLRRSEQSVTDWSEKSWNQLKPSGYSIKPNNSSGESTYRIIGPIKFVNKLLKMWKIDRRHAACLLGCDEQDREYVNNLLQGNTHLVEGSETEDRIAYLFYIWSVLSELLRDNDVEIKWLRAEKRELGNKAPMELILSGSITNLLLVKEFVDLISGRSGSC